MPYYKEADMDDKQLRQDIIDELDFEPSIDSANIGVAVDDGVVTLTGHVPSSWQKWMVERTVWRVKGVRALAQEIEVRLPSDKKDADDEIAERVLNMLAWDVAVPNKAIRVKVQEGSVTLDGEVNWNYQRKAAEDDVRKLSGVCEVINNIAIKPMAQSADVRKRIEDALKRHAELEAGQIMVDVRDNGAVTLKGMVDNWEERQAVERAAWSAPGVRTIDDQISIR